MKRWPSLGNIKGEEKIVGQIGVDLGGRWDVGGGGGTHLLILYKQCFFFSCIGYDLGECLDDVVLGVEIGANLHVIYFQHHVA